MDPECTILMGMSGAMVPAGMRRVVRFMIENRLAEEVKPQHFAGEEYDW